MVFINFIAYSTFMNAGPALERYLRGGGCIFIYSSYARLISFEINFITKETSRAERIEYMCRIYEYTPPPPPN